MKNLKPKSQEMFIKICSNEFNKLRKDENLIFENLNFTFNWDNEYKKFKESNKYMEFLNENSDYEKMKMIKTYFEESIIYPIIEGMYFKAKDLPITSEILLENTYDTFTNKILKKKVNPELIEYFENIYLNLDQDQQIKLLEEFGLGDMAGVVKSGAIGSARFMKKIAYDLAITVHIFYYILRILFYLPEKIPFLDIFLNKFITMDDSIKPIIKKELSTLSIERPELKDFFESELNTNIKEILKECWTSNIKTIDVNSSTFINTHPIFYKFYALMKAFFYKSLLKPYDLETNISKKNLLHEIKASNTFNKMISNYRLCAFNHIIDYISSYAQVSLDIGNVENNLIKKLNQTKKSNNSQQLLKTYKEFFDLNPRTKAEKIFVNSVSNLIYLKEILIRVKMDINSVAFHDRYIKRDVDILIKKIDQSIQNIMDLSRNQNRPPQRNYEESLRDNREKKLVGNEPTEPKKISVFDI